MGRFGTINVKRRFKGPWIMNWQSEVAARQHNGVAKGSVSNVFNYIVVCQPLAGVPSLADMVWVVLWFVSTARGSHTPALAGGVSHGQVKGPA
jgi:hypothetical protein